MSFFSSAMVLSTIIDQSHTSKSLEGLKLSMSKFEGYSPIIDGSIRIVLAEESNSIEVKVIVKSSRSDLVDTVRIDQRIIAARISIEIVVVLPKISGNLEVQSLSLPILVQSTGKCDDIVLSDNSGRISVGNVDSTSLTVLSKSESIEFTANTEQHVRVFTKLANSSGHISISSSVFTPDLQISSQSGSIKLLTATNASCFGLSNFSASIDADIDCMNKDASEGNYDSRSGSMRIVLRRWSGFLTAQSGSGSKKIFGDNLRQINGGWQKGEGSSSANFTTKSGSIHVEAL